MHQAVYVLCIHTHTKTEENIHTDASPLSHIHVTHIDAVTLPPAQPVYIISSVWFCSLLNSMGIWDIFSSLPPSLPLALCVSPTLPFLLPLPPPPPYPLSQSDFLHHPSFVSQYSLRHKPFHLLLIFSLVSLPAFVSPAICFSSAHLLHSLLF